MRGIDRACWVKIFFCLVRQKQNCDSAPLSPRQIFYWFVDPEQAVQSLINTIALAEILREVLSLRK